MGWLQKRRARKKFQERYNSLDQEDKELLSNTEKEAYLHVAKKLVAHRGRINAVKDFPTEIPLPKEERILNIEI